MAKKDLQKYLNKDVTNLAEMLDDELLGKISNKVLAGYQEDLTSMQEWLDSVEHAIKLAELKKEPKNTPFPNAANVKFPLIINACQQFGANIYPEIIKDGKVVKAAVLGKDMDGSKAIKARNVSDYMSYQLLFQSTDWEKSLDKLLNQLPIIGFLCKKTYYDVIKQRNISEVCDYKDIVINSDATSLQDASRITHILHFRLNDLVAQSRNGLFLEDSVSAIHEMHKDLDTDKHIDCLEQHRGLDLDEDGFEEPYIVTVEKSTGKVLRIYPRYKKEDIKENAKGKVMYIKACEYFTDFHFLPNPSGKFQSIGFGTLMAHLNQSVNTILNQLIDAGTLDNMQGGYIDSRVQIQSGNSRHKPGEWVRAKATSGMLLKDGFMPITYKGPSQTLFHLLGLLIQASKELSSSTEAMQGSSMPDNAKTGAVASIIDRGLKVFSAIYRRVNRSLKDEYQKIFLLNAEYMDTEEYMLVLDDKKAIMRSDFDVNSVDVMTVADPNLSSDAQRMGQVQLLQSLEGKPGVDSREIILRTLEFARIPNPEKILPPPQPTPPGPDTIELQAKIVHMAADTARKDRELSLAERRFQLDVIMAEGNLEQIKSLAIKNIALAEAAEAGTQLQDYAQSLDMINSRLDTVMQLKQMSHEKELQSAQNQMGDPNEQQQAPPPGMGGAPDDAAVPQAPPGPPPVQ
jgi:chaperonin GroES